MSINTYEALNTVSLASAASAATFTSIPQGYTDLILVCNIGSQTTNAFPYLQFNGDTETNYSFSQLYGTGSGAFNSRVANTNQLFNSDVSMKQDAVNSINIYHIMNYSNTTTFKTSLSRQNTVNAADYNGALAAVGVWRSTSAINRIDVKATRSGTAYNFIAGSTFTLYGVKAWLNTESSPKAIGGVVSSTSTHWIHSFPFSETFTPTATITEAEYLVIAGGGGGGENAGAGGGAGGYRSSVVGESSGGGASAESTRTFNSGTSYTITVGAGGGFGPNGGVTNGGRRNGGNGTSSSITGSGFTTVTTTGGGGGSAGGSGPTTFNGVSGGSGGGATVYPSGSFSGGAGTANEGYRGGNAAGYLWGAGGGGAGGAGQDINSSGQGGTLGGIGVASAITGTSIYRAGGGSGWTLYEASLGGSKSNSNGAVSTGAGGGEYSLGGSGVVIIRYPK
jgi:hypothetical protein